MSSTAKEPSGRERELSGGQSAAPKRRPKGSAKLRAAAKQQIERVEEVASLYRPLHEAAEAELGKTKSGRRLLRDIPVIAADLGELYKRIGSGKVPYEEGHRLARQRRDEFLERHKERLFDAHAAHARLLPSVEAVTQILRPEMTRETSWVVEAAFLRSMMLQPKLEMETVEQGLGDPMPPQPVRTCITPPYQRREEYPLAPIFGEVTQCDAEIDGELHASGYCWVSPPLNAEATFSAVWVGNDFDVPKGINSYAATVDYDWAFSGVAYAVFGVAVVNLDVAILIDKGDGTPPDPSAHSVCLLTVPFAAGDHFGRLGSEKTTIPLRRVVDTPGKVRVMVGCDGHCCAVAAWGGAGFYGHVSVHEICLNSTV